MDQRSNNHFELFEQLKVRFKKYRLQEPNQYNLKMLSILFMYFTFDLHLILSLLKCQNYTYCLYNECMIHTKWYTSFEVTATH